MKKASEKKNSRLKNKTAKKITPARVLKGARASRASSWELRLYVAGQTLKSITAFNNLKAVCEEYLKGQYRIEIIDLLERPQLAKGDQIVAIPTLVRQLPQPIKKIIGDLSNTEKLLVGLNIKPLRRS